MTNPAIGGLSVKWNWFAWILKIALNWMKAMMNLFLDKLDVMKNQCVSSVDYIQDLSFRLCITVAESFHSVKYGSSNVKSILPSNNLFSFWVSRWIFLNNQLYWHFLYCIGFNLKKISCRKSKYLKSTVEYWQNNWHLHNLPSRRTRLRKPSE